MKTDTASTPPLRNALSICMIVKNEAAVLDRCLASVGAVADELVVVDTGSQDETPEIARRHGARVTTTQWRNDFSYARNISIKQACCDWILWLDADDIVPQSSHAELQRLKNTAPDKVYSMIVVNQKAGGVGSEFRQARMFPKRADVYFERRIHEQIMLSALRAGLKQVESSVRIEHHGYARPEELKRKALRNIDMLLEEYDHQHPDSVMAVELADAYLITDNPQQAHLWFANALRQPGIEAAQPAIASHAHFGLGKILIDHDQADEALAHLQQALALLPDRPDVLYSLAVAYEHKNALDHAIRCLQKILSIDAAPTQVSIDFREARLKAFLRLERLLGQAQDREKLLDIARTALNEMPQRPEIHSMHGRILIKCGKLLEALHAFEHSLQLVMRDNLDAYIGLCYVYHLAGHKQALESTLNNIRAPFGERPRMHALLRIIGHENIGTGKCPAPREIAAEETLLRGQFARI
ncbi:MAG: glycosyltransferase [Chitinivibrionales bacterium]|nr:glycosyltransferase [Chitinivibrionales bacterium]